MQDTKELIERLKILQCPTGDIEYRIAAILKDHNIENVSKIKVDKNEAFIDNGEETYNAEITLKDGKSIVVVAKSGMDDYVAKVVDAYIS